MCENHAVAHPCGVSQLWGVMANAYWLLSMTSICSEAEKQKATTVVDTHTPLEHDSPRDARHTLYTASRKAPRPSSPGNTQTAKQHIGKTANRHGTHLRAPRATHVVGIAVVVIALGGVWVVV